MKDPDVPSKGPGAPSKYRSMVKKTPVQGLAADPTKEPSPTNPIMVEKADGSIAQWGNDLKPSKPPVPPVKKQILMSDKANGNDNNYSSPRNQQQGKDVPTIKPSAKYRY